MKPDRVGFHVLHEYQRAILAPVYDLLKGEFECTMTADMAELEALQPKVVVVSDQQPRHHRAQFPGTLWVFVRHGFGSKGYVVQCMEAADIGCVSSEWSREDGLSRGWRPRMGLWVTGFVAMDGVLDGRSALTPPPLPATFPKSGPTILFAPTYNPTMNAIEVGAKWVRAVREKVPGVRVVIKPHPNTAERHPAAMEILQTLAKDPAVHLVADAHGDVYPYFPMADVLLTDISSVMFFYLALDRPIILVDNPRRHEEVRYFDPEGPEWTWRDMGHVIGRADELPDAVCHALQHPRDRGDRRALYRRRVFGDLLDGRAAQRIADNIRGLLCPAPAARQVTENFWHGLETLNRQPQAVVDMERKLQRAEHEVYRLKAVEQSLAVRLANRLDKFPRMKSALKNVLKPGAQRGSGPGQP